MIPVYEEELLYGELEEEETIPGLTWKLNEEAGTIERKIDGTEALRQAIFCMLQIERFAYEIYSEDYGVELHERFGQPLEFATMEIEETIADTLLQDDRIVNVSEFQFLQTKEGLQVQFTVEGTDGTSL